MLKTGPANDNPNPARRGARWQFVLRTTRWGSALPLALALALAGCHSVYHRTQRDMKAAPCAELQLRIEEARHAETLALSAGRKVRDALKAGTRGDTLGFHLDRLEMTALDLGRHAQAVADAATQCPSAPVDTARHLQERSRNLAGWARKARAGEPAATVAALETWLHDPPGR